MLSIGKKAVAAAEKQLEVTGHNISNVNTPGYSRQRVIQEAAYPIQTPWANIGTGVDLVRIERMRDIYLDNEYRQLNGNTGYWNSMSKNLQELEKNVIETSEYGIHAMINSFFNSWESLSNNPFSSIHRQEIVSNTKDMIQAFQNLYRSIDNKIQDVKYQMADATTRINQISNELASTLNTISMHKTQGTPINDLLDSYDLLLDELSGYGNIQVIERENNTFSVYLGTVELVRNNEPQQLILEDRLNSMTGEMEFFISWDNIKTDVNGFSGLTSGSLKSLYDLKDVILPGYQQKLDELVVQIVREVNAVHTKGYSNFNPPSTGAYFFDPSVTGVMNFKISKEVLSNPEFIAASLTGASGDNQTALMMTDLRLAKIFGGQTLTENFADIVYILGNDVKLAKSSEARYSMLSQQSDNFRESVKGVSINEETANLMQYQQAYQAAAKIISVADDMLKTILGLIR